MYHWYIKVRQLINITGYMGLSGRVIPLLACMLMLGACASTQFVSDPAVLPPLQRFGPELDIADVDVLEVSPAMDEFLEHYILPYKDSQTRLHLLTTSVTSKGVLGFDYDAGRTATAAEAFQARSGNCIGFANMLIALARRAGLKASYQEVIRQPEWFSREDTILLMKHVNVVIESRRFTYVMDASNIRIKANAVRRIVDDDYAKALYLNNHGAEALIENDLPKAYAYMKKAMASEPEMTDSWVNMGVVFGRNEQLDDAVTVLKQALQLDAYQYSAMSNLYEIYMEQGNMEAAATLQAKVDRYRRANPYYLLHLSDEAVVMDQYEQSLKLLQRALKKQDQDHVLYFALARTQYLTGEKLQAENSLMRARELAPQNKLAFYERPLGELVAEYEAELLAEQLAEQTSMLP